jgi:hypothetical protein
MAKMHPPQVVLPRTMKMKQHRLQPRDLSRGDQPHHCAFRQVVLLRYLL